MVWIKMKYTWSSHVYKALCGIKQVLRTWYGRFDGFLMGLDFTKSKVDYNLCDKFDDYDDSIHRMLMDTTSGEEVCDRMCKCKDLYL